MKGDDDVLTLLVKLFSALNSESSTRQISLAICLGFIVGLSPFFSIHNLLLLLLVLLLKVHLGSFILSVGIFSGLSYLLSGSIVQLGEYLLTQERLNGILTTLYQFDIFKLAHLHHTYTFGAVIFGCVFAPLVYLFSNFLIQKYRTHIKMFFEKLPLVKALKASKFYQLYIEVTTASLIPKGVK